MADRQELVSVIVPIFNIERQLPKCLESLSAQTYRNIEILLIDDGSTDGSGRLCEEYAAVDSRARVIHQENQGIWYARNRGVEESKGDYLAFPDGDDYFHKDYIRLLYEAINDGGEEYPMAICDYRKVWDYDGDTESESHPFFEAMDQKALLDKIVVYPSCIDALWGANWNKLYRKSVLPVPFQKDFLRCQDYEANLRVCFQIERAVFVPKTLYYWFQWNGQRTQSLDDKLIRNECRSRIFLDSFLTIPEHLSDYRPSLLSNLYRRLVMWKKSVQGLEEEREVTGQIRTIERKTFLYLLAYRQIPFRRKVRWFLSLHAPFLLRLFGK
jgi:Glycosyltransferases involved in cell wall biogenesis